MEYKLTFLKGCPFVDYGEGLMLIDLGLPFSIADKGTIGFDGATKSVPRERGPINTPVLSDWFEQPVTGVIGGDILLGTPIKIDYKAGMLVTHYDGPVGQKIGQTSMGYSIVELSIDGKRCRCFIDTGAQYSKILPRMVAGKTICASVEDCVWGDVGNRLNESLYNTVFACNGVEYEAGCAALSPTDAVNVEQAGASGVIGKDFFDHHTIVIKGGTVYASNY